MWQTCGVCKHSWSVLTHASGPGSLCAPQVVAVASIAGVADHFILYLFLMFNAFHPLLLFTTPGSIFYIFFSPSIASGYPGS